jgi:peptide/nickel transport system ATP-binding protein
VPYTRNERRDRAQGLLKRSGMAHVSEDARPGELSGGQCQRVAILRAIVAAPELIVADEPTARQDVITAAAMTDQLRHAAEAGTAIVAVSHNTAWLETFAHRVLALEDGRLAVTAGDVT